MAAFRRCVIALAVLAIFAGLASAQTPTPMSCSLNSFPNTVRLEGKTDQVGDLTILCTGGSVPTAGAALPLVNFSVQLTQNITSRCTSTLIAGACPAGVSDALLLIDEPGTGGGPVGGFGPNQAATFCASPTTGCSAPFLAVVGGTPVMSSSSTSAVNTAPNAYQGVVAGTTVTFFGVPLLAPVSTTGTARIFRLTNIRTDSTSKSPATPVGASVTFTGTNVTSLLSLNQNSATVAIVQNGLDQNNTKVATVGTQPICVTSGSAIAPTTAINVSQLNFVENFGSAFKTRVQPNAAAGSGVSSSTALQNIPGTYASESGLTVTGYVSSTGGASVITGGLADYATRLKASFANIPSGVRLFVSTTNSIGGATPNNYVIAPALVGANIVTSFAQLISTSSAEGAVDIATGPTLASTAALTAALQAAEVPLTGGAGVAMWEVFNSNPTANETFSFQVYLIYTANTVPVTGAAGTVPSPTVNLTYALGAAGGEPQMADTAGKTSTLFNLTNCRTVLMFPYVTSGGGYDTGVAISNTSLDAPVFSTPGQAGTCTLNFYPTANLTPTGTTVVGTAVPAFVSPTIVAGTTYANLASIMAPGFSGYILAACNFQYAHGFIYVANFGNPNTSSAMGYLALDVPDVGSKGTRVVSPAIGINETLTH